MTGKLLIALLTLSAVFSRDSFSQTSLSQVTININLHRLQTVLIPDQPVAPDITRGGTPEVKVTRSDVWTHQVFRAGGHAWLPVSHQKEKHLVYDDYAYKSEAESGPGVVMLYTIRTD